MKEIWNHLNNNFMHIIINTMQLVDSLHDLDKKKNRRNFFTTQMYLIRFLIIFAFEGKIEKT